MSERSCSIPLVVRLRGSPDDERLAEMSEMIARTVADRLSEAARIIVGLEGWTSYRKTHTPPAIRFSGGSLDTTLQQRVAAAIEAGITRAVSSVSSAVLDAARLPSLALPPAQAAPAAGPPRLEPQETETGWSLNGISVFRVQRPDSELDSSRLIFQPSLSTYADGSTKLLIRVFRDPNVAVLLQPDAISQLTRLASEIDIRDMVTVMAPEDRPLALGARPSTETRPPTSIPEQAEALPSPTRQELQQAIDAPTPASADAIAYPQFVASPLLPSTRHGFGNIEEAAGIRANDPNVFSGHPEWSFSQSLGSRREPDTLPQLPDAPSSDERHDLPQAARYDPTTQQLAEFPETGSIVGAPFDRFTPDGAFGEEQPQVERVIVFQSRTLLTDEEFTARVERARGPSGLILPYKKAGAERSELSPIHAARLSGNRVLVYLRHDIFATAYAADRDLRLPPAIGKGVELNEMDVVGVKFIDEGVLSFVPAMLLVHLENDATRAALIKAGEGLASGPAMTVRPQPAVAEGGEALTTEPHVDTSGTTDLASADRIAVDLDLADTRLREHREWIIATSPDTGGPFVDAMEELTTYARSHGMGGGVSGRADFRDNLQKRYQDWRETVDALKSRLSEANIQSIAQIGKTTENLLRSLESGERTAEPRPSSPLASGEMKTPSEQPSTEAEPTNPPVGAAVAPDRHARIEHDTEQNDGPPGQTAGPLNRPGIDRPLRSDPIEGAEF